jgi:ankyrin repeat protein
VTIDIEASYFGTVLQAAASDGAMAMVELLLEHSPNLEVRAGVFGTPLHTTVYKRRTEMAQLILDRASPYLTLATVDAGGRLPLHVAVLRDCESLAKILSTDEVLFLTLDFQDRPALHFAAGRGSTDFAHMVRDKHPDAIHNIDCDGWTPLHWECRQCDEVMIALLLQHNTEKEAKTQWGWKPPRVALYHGVMSRDLRKVIDLVEPDNQEEPPPSPGANSADEEERLPVKKAELARSSENVSFSCDSLVV